MGTVSPVFPTSSAKLFADKAEPLYVYMQFPCQNPDLGSFKINFFLIFNNIKDLQNHPLRPFLLKFFVFGSKNTESVFFDHIYVGDCSGLTGENSADVYTAHSCKARGNAGAICSGTGECT